MQFGGGGGGGGGGVIASIGVSLLAVAHPLRENISSAGYTPMYGSHSRPIG